MAGPVPERAMRHGAAARRFLAAEDFGAARREITAALTIVDRGPRWWHSPMKRLLWARAAADGLAILGEIDMARGRPDLALQSFEECLRRYESLSFPESADFSIVLNNLGIAYERLGRLDESETALRRALEIDRRIRRGPEAEAATLSNLALTLETAGRHGEAAEALARAAALTGLSPATTRHLDQERSYHMVTRGEFADALVALREQFDRAGPDSMDAAHIAGGIAQAYAEMQDLKEAARWHRRAVRIRRNRQPDSLALAQDLHNLSLVLSTDGQDAEAGALLDEAMDLAEAIAPGSPTAVGMRGAMLFRLLEGGDPAGAVSLGEQILAEARTEVRHLIGVYLAIGIGCQELDRPDRARTMFEQACAIGERISPLLPDVRWARTALGALLLEQGDADGAADSFDRAIEVAESMRPGSAAEPGLGLMFGTARVAYHGRIQAAWLRNTPEEAAIAFRTAESFRARTLAEMLAGTGAVEPSEAAVEVVGELDEVRRELGGVYREIVVEPARHLLDRRDRLEQRAERLRLRLRALDPRAADQDYPPPCTVAEVQDGLDPSVTLALYTVTDHGIFLFTVRHDDLGLTRLAAGTETIAAAAAEVDAACRDADSAVPDDALRRLGEWLLRPLAGRLGNLAVCADDVLAYLPFEALELDGVVLVERSVVWSIPSATVLTRFGGTPRRHRPRRPFAGFAMPRTPGQDLLPGTVREVYGAAEALGDDRSAIDETATVASVWARAPEARYVHFAMHGLISDDRPLFSGFPLSGDEFLHAYQMADLDLCADLVVGSACETAKGESRAGEGTVGLAYALFAAGARAVLVSRWPVGDSIAPRQMRELYRLLAAGVPVAQAHREAARKLRRRHPHPREWAVFLLIDLAAGGRT
ncbi:CHAT domain-containing protein [Actinoplanes couchii]|uniref:CHAT domain-containing protein n=1 Tax=Actinoplanes couchii TaxID=403638 RepID=A0ABQ3WZJ1_9ACTN|nr:CHAT domain-containing tetratricopeptide repeat protein [Actinoplanes couchii]MDR6316073.1 tetratricopeptide (TPR) repeat protein [Actinoplanes couchii]GID51687.1 hypothetical protein Aco03nite_000910 [Actinoplanes couchii]